MKSERVLVRGCWREGAGERVLVRGWCFIELFDMNGKSIHVVEKLLDNLKFLLLL